jgi:hypothetical protein
MPETVSILDAGEDYLAALAASDWIEIPEWKQLPRSLTQWMQAQDGLKIDNSPISNQEALINAYHLVHGKNDTNNLSAIQIAFAVAICYIKKVSRPRKECVDDLLILGAPPRNVMPRKCRKCGQRVLNDAFSYYAKLDSTRYVIWTLEFGCGLPGCSGKTVLIPSDDKITYIPPLRKQLERPRNTRNPAKWERYFIRSLEECGTLPRIVMIRCDKCNGEESDHRPRWTAEDTPRYVRPRRKCRPCNKYASWLPSDNGIRTVESAILTRLWSKFLEAGCSPDKYPRIPGVYFSRSKISTRIRQLKEARERMEGK